MKKVNLKNLIVEITEAEGLNQLSNVAQVSEILALLGKRWRDMGREEALLEFDAIFDRAGKQSNHN